jgi:putative membrane protein
LEIAMKPIACATLAVVSLLFAASAYSQDSKLAAADQDFLKKAAQANIAEVEAGKLAQSKGSRPDIKQFGQKMEQDHGKTLQELQGLAKSKGVTLPDAPDAAHQAQAKRLATATGKDFDKAYVANAGVADHKAAKELFEKGTKSKDPEVSAFAKKVLPDIEHHLSMAQQMAKQP